MYFLEVCEASRKEVLTHTHTHHWLDYVGRVFNGSWWENVSSKIKYY